MVTLNELELLIANLQTLERELSNLESLTNKGQRILKAEVYLKKKIEHYKTILDNLGKTESYVFIIKDYRADITLVITLCGMEKAAAELLIKLRYENFNIISSSKIEYSKELLLPNT